MLSFSLSFLLWLGKGLFFYNYTDNKIKGMKFYLGSFDTVEKAKVARLEAERKILEEHPRKK